MQPSAAAPHSAFPPPRFPVPSADLAVSLPDLAEARALAEANREAFRGWACSLAGVPLREVRREFREEAARTLGADPETLWILTGHQPSPFHPGVWLKHRFTAEAARRWGAEGISVVMDQDLADGGCFVCPSREPGDGDGMAIRLVDADGVPWEGTPPPSAERLAAAREALERRALLPEGALDHLRLFFRSLAEFSPPPPSANGPSQSPSWPSAFAAARGACERELGFSNREALFSSFAETGAFGLFLGEILARAAEFAEVFNQAVRRYRQAARVRSRAHPFPDLHVARGAIELPFWVSRPGGPRERLFLEGNPPSLRSPGGVDHRIPERIFRNPMKAAVLPRMLAEAGLRVRPRAAAVTAFLRCVAADLFVHGAGGARYDRVTDEAIRGFFGIEPPLFVGATGTLRLFPPAQAQAPSLGPARARRRRILFSPERFLENGGRDPLAEEKRRRLREWPQGREERRANYRRIHALNDLLRGRVSRRLEEAAAAVEAAERAQARQDLLLRRDAPFFLHPFARLREFFAAVVQEARGGFYPHTPPATGAEESPIQNP